MAHGSARIDSPDVIKEFRNRFAIFDGTCRKALSDVQRDVQRTAEWLQREQLLYWKKELRRRTERFTVARLEYQRARREATRSPQSTAIDARIAFQRATRLKEEAEAKLRAVKKWMVVLEHDAANLMAPCLALCAQLERLTPRALTRLDRMVDSLEDYLRTAPADLPAQPSEE